MPARSNTYELWNEQNLPNEFYGGTVAQLASLVIAGYNAIKTADPSAVVLSSCPTGSGGPAYLDSLLAQSGVPAKLDGISFHLYVQPGQPELTLSWAKEYKNVMAKYGLSNLPMFSSEATWHTYNLTGVLQQPVNPDSKGFNTKREANLAKATVLKGNRRQ